MSKVSLCSRVFHIITQVLWIWDLTVIPGAQRSAAVSPFSDFGDSFNGGLDIDMASFSILLLKNPTAAQIDETVSLCLRAYEGDESLLCLVGGDKSLLDPMFRAMIRATAVGGEFYVAVNDSGKILGLGLWFGPGEDMFATEEQRKAGFYDFFGGLSPEAQKWWMETYRVKMGEFLTEHLGPKGKLNSYFLSNLATDPAFQRMGIATKIVDTVFQQAIAEDNRLGLIASTAQNVLIYESMGWRNEGQTSLEAPTGSVTCTLLTKDARDKEII